MVPDLNPDKSDLSNIWQ